MAKAYLEPGGSNQLTRRKVLKGALGVAALATAPAFLAACGGSNDTTSGSTTTGGSTSASSTENAGTVGGTLNYLGWQGEDFAGPLGPWRKENGVHVQASYFAEPRDVIAKYTAGGVKADIICGSSTSIPGYLEGGVPLMALDTSQIPNYPGLTKFFQENELFYNENGDLVTVPFAWSAMGITYDTTQVAKPTSWEDIFKPEYKGKITMYDDANTAFGVAAPLLGINLNEATEDELQTIKDYLAKVVAQALRLSPSFGDMSNSLAAGDVVAAWGGMPMVNTFAGEAGNPNITTAVDLSEGTVSFAEFYAIPSTGENPATAYSMINEILDPKINAVASNELLLAPCVEAAWNEADPSVKKLYPQKEADLEKFLVDAPMVINAPLQSTEFVTVEDVNQAWLEITS